MDKKIKVLVADDNPVVWIGIRAMLERAENKDVEVVGEAADGREAVARTGVLAPDVILMDLMMPVMDGVAASREILSRHREARIVALTGLGEQGMGQVLPGDVPLWADGTKRRLSRSTVILGPLSHSSTPTWAWRTASSRRTS